MDKDVLSTTEYVNRMALVLDLQLNSEYRTGVIENFARIKAIAQLVKSIQAGHRYQTLLGATGTGKSDVTPT